MHQAISLLALLLVVSVSTFAATLTGRVIKVTDGDTITVLEDNTQHRIRL